MRRASELVAALSLTVLLISSAGCVHRLNGPAADSLGETPAPIPFSAGEYSTRVAELEDRSLTHADAAVRARASRELALIFSHPDNPDREYRRAAGEMKMYLENTSEKDRPPEAGRLLFLLSELAALEEEQQELRDENEGLKELTSRVKEENESIRHRNDQLSGRVQKLGELYTWLAGLRLKIETLTDENEKMRTALEEMKSLDLWLDEQKGRLK